ncbi:sigma-54-dependent transcriptional regulator [Proteus hauseri]|uniref:sigma-54-dependent transcriptional regulator n=1 Tax=Proteus hauseri TaxID=183417 RepID=UPI0010094BC9|nr:sigma-54 dependent transcriptional regulator [Proteus hauseri]QAV22604.1 two-component system response regulator [Proteus hauseri]
MTQSLMPDVDVLLIDDDEDILESYRHLLNLAGMVARVTDSPEKALKALTPEWQGAVVLDIYMPAMNGMEVLERIKQIDPRIPVIMITGHGDIPLAVEAVKKGAYDFIEKPINPPAFLELVAKAHKERLSTLALRNTMINTTQERLVGDSAQITAIREQVQQLADIDKDLMIEGEMGTGRHLLAQLLHELSPRNEQSIQTVDCQNLPDIKQVIAQIETEGIGTLILRSPYYLSSEAQRWLSSYLLDIERQGKRHFRTIAILENNTQELVTDGRLIPEFYYYFSQITFSLPPLSARRPDIIPLFRAFLRQSAQRLGIAIPKIDRNYLDILKRYDWPGNIRELRNVAELYAVGIVKMVDSEQHRAIIPPEGPLDNLVDEYERRLIEDALYLFAGRVSDVADYLGIPRKKLYLRMKKHDLDKDSYKPKM